MKSVKQVVASHPVSLSLSRARNRLQQSHRAKRQRGFTIVETMVVLGGIAIALIFIVQGGLFLRNHVRAYQLTNEAQAFSQGILAGTVNDANFSGITTAAMVNNNAFESVGSRASKTNGTVTGIWGSDITLAPATLTTTDDAVDLTYPSVPSGVCPLAVQTLTSTFQEIHVNGTTVYSASVPLTDAAVGTACAASTWNTLDLYVTRTS